MRTVLLLGALGMLGHKVWQQLASGSEVIACIHGTVPESLKLPGALPQGHILENTDLSQSGVLRSAFSQANPDIVINCAGVLTQPSNSNDVIKLVKVNAELPHQLSKLCEASNNNCKLIHISSDGVFSGKVGNYSEQDQPDANDFYGMSKILGEVKERGLNIRTSIIGFQLSQPKGLLEWLITQKGKEITGYDGYSFSGLTTTALARIIHLLIESNYELEGTVHVGAKKITKYELLKRLDQALSLNCRITKSSQAAPNCTGKIDRSLNSSNFYQKAGLTQPEWDEMIKELTNDLVNYRRTSAPGQCDDIIQSGAHSNA